MNNHTLTERFAQYLKEDGKRLPTIQSYAGDVDGFPVYLKQMGSDFDGNLKRFHITSYRNTDTGDVSFLTTKWYASNKG